MDQTLPVYRNQTAVTKHWKEILSSLAVYRKIQLMLNVEKAAKQIELSESRRRAGQGTAGRRK